MKNWHALWQVGTQSWKSGTSFGTLARKPSRHASTVARRPRWHVGTHGTRFSKLFAGLLTLTLIEKNSFADHFDEISSYILYTLCYKEHAIVLIGVLYNSTTTKYNMFQVNNDIISCWNSAFLWLWTSKRPNLIKLCLRFTSIKLISFTRVFIPFLCWHELWILFRCLFLFSLWFSSLDKI